MQEQDREVARRSDDVVAASVAVREPASGRRAKGTRPPEPTSAPAPVVEGDLVECKNCKARIPFSAAIILQSHCLCTTCSFNDSRNAALKSLKPNAESTKLPHTLGAPLAALLVTVLLTALLVLVYNV